MHSYGVSMVFEVFRSKLVPYLVQYTLYDLLPLNKLRLAFEAFTYNL
jgi:hypothetical protein